MLFLVVKSLNTTKYKDGLLHKLIEYIPNYESVHKHSIVVLLKYLYIYNSSMCVDSELLLKG